MQNATTHVPSNRFYFEDRKHTSAEYETNMGRNLFRQYSLKRRVMIGRGNVKDEARESFLSAKIPTAIMCMSTREKMVELCTIGQNFPAVSYLGVYTLMNCNTQAERHYNPYQKQF